MDGTYAVIGDPIDHSLSPLIHGAAFRHLGMDCSYMAYRVKEGELDDGVVALKGAGIAGFNVTIPHKVAIIEYIDRLDGACTMAGAANTISVRDGALYGYNTDVGGFMDPLERRGIGVGGISVLVLGAGGAARAAVVGLASAGARSVSVSGRGRAREEDLRALAGRLGLESPTYKGDISAHDMIVNATPVGMSGEPSPVSMAGVRPQTIIYDMVYKPVKTGLVKDAENIGCTVIYGYEMLLGQAARSFKVWHGIEAPYDIMRRALMGGA